MIRTTATLDLEGVLRTQSSQVHHTAQRSSTMFLMNEALARAHIDTRQQEARSAAVAVRIVRARRAQRRAAEAVIRSRRAAAHLQ